MFTVRKILIRSDLQLIDYYNKKLFSSINERISKLSAGENILTRTSQYYNDIEVKRRYSLKEQRIINTEKKR